MAKNSDNLSYVIGELELASAAIVLAQFEASCRHCFRTHRVQLVQLFLSCDGRRAVIVFRAPDAESVRQICRRAGMPVKRIWACQQPYEIESAPTAPS